MTCENGEEMAGNKLKTKKKQKSVKKGQSKKSKLDFRLAKFRR